MVKKKQDTDSSNKMSDWVKKALLTGAGAVFMTEDGIKNALSDLKMPKNAILAAVAQADKAKEEVASLIAKEVKAFLDRIAVEDIIQKALAGQSVEITATIRFSDNKKEQKKAAKMTAKLKKDKP